MCVPNGYTKFDGSKNAVASSPGSTPGGRFQATLAIRASSPKVFPLSGEPFTANFPSCHSRSASLAEPDGPRHLGGTEATDLAVGRDADAQIATRFPRFGLLGAELLVVEHLERFVERALVVPRVVGDPGGHGVRKLVLGDQVLAP